MNALIAFILAGTIIIMPAQPVQITDWESAEELVQFILEDDTNERQWTRDTFDCDDFSYQLRDRALAKGKYLSVVYVAYDEYNSRFDPDLSANGYSYHMINMARVGNTLWLIEPQTDDLEILGDVD